MGLIRKKQGGVVKKSKSSTRSNSRKAKTKKRGGGGNSKMKRGFSAVTSLASDTGFLDYAKSNMRRPTVDGRPGRRRMNPMNAKATRKAAKRVRSSLKFLEKLKKSLPHVTAKGSVTKGKARR